MQLQRYLVMMRMTVLQFKMTGSASMAVLGQKYIWNMTYRDGTAHYEYKEPVSKTVDVEMNPNYFQFSSLTQNMVKKSKISGNEITFTIPAEKAKNKMLDSVAGKRIMHTPRR